MPYTVNFKTLYDGLAKSPNYHVVISTNRRNLNIDGFVKSAGLVMPDLIRHPEHIENTIAATQLPSATGSGHLPEEGFHLSNRTCSQAHGFRPTPE